MSTTSILLEEVGMSRQRRWNAIIEWTLGLSVPLVVAGPIYYVHQGSRFQVIEAFGCTNTLQISVLELLTLHAWTLIPPLLSICFYYPKVIRVFYRQSRDIRSFLNSNTSVSRTNYLRILALASVDILLTLPIGTVNVVLSITSGIAQGSFPLYVGWSLLHNGWEPVGYPYTEVKALGTATLTQLYFTHWSSPVLAFVIFGLFGLTSDARASYWRIICTAGAWLGWKPTAHTRKGQESLGDIEFGARPQDMSLGDVEMGSRRPSFVTPEAPAVKEDAEHTPDESMPPKSLSLSNKKAHPCLSQDIEGKHRLLTAGTSSSSASDAVDI